MMRKIFLLLMVILTSSCTSTMKDASDVLSNLSKPSDLPSKVTMMIYADERINKNLTNEAAPVNFVIVQLKSDFKLFASAYEDLLSDLEGVLGKTYLEHEEYLAIPGKFTPIDDFKLNKKTRFIAVIGQYRSIEESKWRTAIKVKAIGEEYVMHAAFTQNNINLEVAE